MLIHPMPDPIALEIGPLAVRWYGLMYMLSFLQVLLVGRIRIKQPHMAAEGWLPKDFDDMLFYVVIGTIVGGRLGEVLFYQPSYFFSHPLEIFAIWKGGMSFHGGFIGVLISAAFIWGRKRGKTFFEIADLCAPLAPLAYAFGRIGNFINAELPGKIADPSLPWAMVWPNVDALPRHPSPIYQALGGVIMFIILWLYARKPRPRMAVFGFGTMLYGIARFITEYFRTPDYEVTFSGITISAGQMLSIPMFSVGLGLLLLAYYNARKKATTANAIV